MYKSGLAVILAALELNGVCSCVGVDSCRVLALLISVYTMLVERITELHSSCIVLREHSALVAA